MIWFVYTILVLDRKFFTRHWNLWINFLLFLLSSFVLVLIMSSGTARNLYIIGFGVLSGFYIFFLIQYFRNIHAVSAKVFLEFVSFIYLVTFWQVLSIVYFMLISYGFSIVSAVAAVIPVTFLLGRGIVTLEGLKKSSEALVLLVLTITISEFFIFLALLPLHYYALATLLSVWFFFIVEMVLSGQELSSRRRIFKIYTLVALAAMIVILITSRWG